MTVGQSWFRGKNIIAPNQEYSSSILHDHQTLLGFPSYHQNARTRSSIFILSSFVFSSSHQQIVNSVILDWDKLTWLNINTSNENRISLKSIYEFIVQYFNHASLVYWSRFKLYDELGGRLLMVTVHGNRYGSPISNPGRFCLHFTLCL